MFLELKNTTFQSITGKIYDFVTPLIASSIVEWIGLFRGDAWKKLLFETFRLKLSNTPWANEDIWHLIFEMYIFDTMEMSKQKILDIFGLCKIISS